jgi:hypothetical protein
MVLQRYCCSTTMPSAGMPEGCWSCAGLGDQGVIDQRRALGLGEHVRGRLRFRRCHQRPPRKPRRSHNASCGRSTSTRTAHLVSGECCRASREPPLKPSCMPWRVDGLSLRVTTASGSPMKGRGWSSSRLTRGWPQLKADAECLSGLSAVARERPPRRSLPDIAALLGAAPPPLRCGPPLFRADRALSSSLERYVCCESFFDHAGYYATGNQGDTNEPPR